MRPAPVLVLVLVAVAALVIALFVAGSRGKDERVPSAAGPVGPQIETPAGQSTNLRPTGERTPTAQPVAPSDSTRSVPVATEARTSVEAGAVGAWANALRVSVMAPDGSALAGANVEVRPDPGNAFGELLLIAQAQSQPNRAPPQTGRTNEVGEVRIQNLAPGRYAISAVHADYARGELAGIEVAETGEALVNVKLDPGLALEGRVLDQGGAPIPEATLTLVPSLFYNLPPDHPQYVARALRTQTDANGHYRFSRVEAGSHSLTASAEGYGSRTQQNVLIVGYATPTPSQDFRLDPEFKIGGRVFASNRTPIAGVEILAMNYSAAQTSIGRAKSGPDGRFEIGALAFGTYQLIARAPGYREGREQRVEAGDMNVAIEMPELGGAAGRVTSAVTGQPVTSFDVLVRRALQHNTAELGRAERRESVRSDTGEFRINALDDAEYVVEIEAPGHARTASERFRVEQGIITPGVDVALTLGGVLVGRVVDARSGEPVSGARVSTREPTHVPNPLGDIFREVQARNTTERTVRTGADGRFRMDLLTPGKYQLEVEHTGLVTQFVSELTVAVGQETAVPDVRLSSGGTVRGRVTDTTGAPLVGARITMVGTAGTPFYSEHTDAQGRYTVRRIAAGSYRITAQRPSGPGNPVEIFAPILDIEQTKREILVNENADLQIDFTIDRS